MRETTQQNWNEADGWHMQENGARGKCGIPYISDRADKRPEKVVRQREKPRKK
jgi:hypothetical protein